ncbi:MAG: hypothetical protein HN855_04825 [Anaerolineae bacterium]|mgnify:CR=1 FL=1|jgi:hypothetical protein|nr:hypothetical protein [Anaerolineae bacterium]MBT7071200.1 hypothetical protein [Anaerolineae bacterium]MBT7324462.1 hypothetical protein [Anaerolineae bacterium]
MSKKAVFLVAAALLATLALVSCAGPVGPEGPEGPQGPEGPAGPAGEGSVAVFGAEYTGSAACGECHTDTYDVFMQSGHPYKLNAVVDGQPPEYPYTEVTELPEGYTWDDISYVIGGYNWKYRFVDNEGFIITGLPGTRGDGNTDYVSQFNFANPVVGNELGGVAYHPGEERKYNCGTCHTTGYDPDTPTEGMPGIVGSWEAPGIQCEECHGPGSLHAANPRGVALDIERDSALCGECHLRGGSEAVDASGGFIKHHEQYEELFQSKHITINCVVCHDPHAGVVALRKANAEDETVAVTRTSCENCHNSEAAYQNSEIHPAALECIDCHMPRVTKSAVGNIDMFTGDIRTHLMGINPGQIEQFTEDGSNALSELGLNFTCRSCHVEGGIATVKTDEELITKAKGYHTEE